MITNCIVCKSKLIPVVYGRLDKDILDMQDKGLLLVGMDKARGVNSFCPLCEESYEDFTLTPEFSSDSWDPHTENSFSCTALIAMDLAPQK